MKSLFTTVPLEEIINVTLDRIYHLKEIETLISKSNMHNLLQCTTYQQNDGAPTGLP